MSFQFKCNKVQLPNVNMKTQMLVTLILVAVFTGYLALDCNCVCDVSGGSLGSSPCDTIAEPECRTPCREHCDDVFKNNNFTLGKTTCYSTNTSSTCTCFFEFNGKTVCQRLHGYKYPTIPELYVPCLEFCHDYTAIGCE